MKGLETAALDGKEFSATLLGTSDVPHAAPIFWCGLPDSNRMTGTEDTNLPDLALRDGKWKLLCEYHAPTHSSSISMPSDRKPGISP